MNTKLFNPSLETLKDSEPKGIFRHLISTLLVLHKCLFLFTLSAGVALLSPDRPAALAVRQRRARPPGTHARPFARRHFLLRDSAADPFVNGKAADQSPFSLSFSQDVFLELLLLGLRPGWDTSAVASPGCCSAREHQQ